jgi:hypothetical protein
MYQILMVSSLAKTKTSMNHLGVMHPPIGDVLKWKWTTFAFLVFVSINLKWQKTTQFLSCNILSESGWKNCTGSKGCNVIFSKSSTTVGKFLIKVLGGEIGVWNLRLTPLSEKIISTQSVAKWGILTRFINIWASSQLQHYHPCCLLRGAFG